MAIDFPASPSVNDTHTVGSTTWTWDGTKWTITSGAAGATDKIEEGNTSAEVIDTGSDGRFVVTTEGTERARVDSSGRLLVGNTNATSGTGFYTQYTNLHVIGGIGTNNGGSIFVSRNTDVASSTNQDLGWLGWGTNEGATFARIAAFVEGTPTGSSFPGLLRFETTPSGGTAPVERMRIDSAGNLLLQKTSAVRTGGGTFFEVPSGPTTMPMYLHFCKTFSGTRDGITFNHNGTQVGGVIFTDTSTAFNTSSDYRLKENVALLTGATDRLKRIPVHRFNFIADPTKTVDGFLAHEAQAVVPECVTGTKDEVDANGDPIYQGIDQSKLVPLLTAALQEAIAEIETLKTRVTTLEGGTP